MRFLGMTLTRPQVAFYRIVLIYLLPIILVYAGVIPQRWSLTVLMLITLLIFLIARLDKRTLESLGFVKDFRISTILLYTLFTIVGVLGIIYFADVLGYAPVDKWYTHPHFLFLFLPVSLLQEFAYRSVLMHELDQIFPEAAQVIFANAGIFTILHTMYPHPHIVLPLTLIGGIAFAALWRLRPNFYLIAASHAVLNFAAVYFDFFSIIA